jgi:hypothetical protein
MVLPEIEPRVFRLMPANIFLAGYEIEGEAMPIS